MPLKPQKERMIFLRKRNCRVKVCFTKDELSALSKKAKKAGMSIGGFVRHSVANKEVKEAPPADIPYLAPCHASGRVQSGSDVEEIQFYNQVPDMPQFRKGLEELRAATKLVSDAYTSDYRLMAVTSIWPIKGE
jgi:hypothetical protein